MTTKELMREIELLQNIQKQHPQQSMAWRFASRKLAPLFAEMARRQANGEI
jgi:hypothetical protein